jgi:hypothetical protein
MNVEFFSKSTVNLSNIWDRLSQTDISVLGGIAGVSNTSGTSTSSKFLSTMINSVLNKSDERKMTFAKACEWFYNLYTDPVFDEVAKPFPEVEQFSSKRKRNSKADTENSLSKTSKTSKTSRVDKDDLYQCDNCRKYSEECYLVGDNEQGVGVCEKCYGDYDTGHYTGYSYSGDPDLGIGRGGMSGLI